MVWAAKAAASEAWAAKADHPFFDGLTDNLDLGDVDTHDNTGSYTMECEIYPFQLIGLNDNPMRMLYKVQSSSIGYFLSIGNATSDGRFRAQQRNGSDNEQIVAVGFIVANVWQHVAYTYNLGALQSKLFYNGVEVAVRNSVVANGASTATLFLGSGKSNLAWYYGRMRNVRMWSIQRSEPELLANKERAVPVDSLGLIFQKFAWTDKATASSSWSDV